MHDRESPSQRLPRALLALEALLLEQERRLQAARLEAQRLAALHREHASEGEPGSLVEVVTGRHAVAQRLSQVRRGARQLRCLRKPADLHRGGTFAPDAEPIPSQVAARTVYDRASVEEPRALATIGERIRSGEQARVLPEVPIRVELIDDGCAVLPLPGHSVNTGAVLVVHASSLLDALSDLFERLWQRAIPLDLLTAEGAPKAQGRSSADAERLSTLLRSGLTDKAIARQLGLGHRTVQRHIAALLRDLDVQTRFQAGVQAAFRERAN